MSEEDAKQQLEVVLAQVLDNLNRAAVVSGLVDELRDQVRAVEVAADGIYANLQPQIGAMRDLANTVAGLAGEARGHLDQAQADLRGRIHPVMEEISTVRELVERTEADVHEQIGELRGVLDEVEETKDEAIEYLTTRIEEVIGQMVSTLNEELVEPIREAKARCEEEVNKLVEKLADDLLPQKLEEMTGEHLANLQGTLELMTETLSEELDAFRAKIGLNADRAKGTRAESEGAQEILQSAFAPVFGELERVRSLAGIVGMSI